MGRCIFFKFTTFTTSSPWRSNHDVVLSLSVSAPFCSFDKRVAMRGWRDADSHSPILSRVMPGDLFLQKNVFFSRFTRECIRG